MALNAFMKIGKAEGEARQGKYGRDKWIEIQGWEWSVEAETSWTKGGGASVGKPNPGVMSWEHYWDRSSHILLGYISTGAAFSEVTMEMCKGTGISRTGPDKDLAFEAFFIVKMNDVFITKVTQKADEQGNVVQMVEMVFKEITIDYRAQGMPNAKNPGELASKVTYNWDIAAGKASPSTGA